MSNFNHERSLVLHDMSSSGPYVSRLKVTPDCAEAQARLEPHVTKRFRSWCYTAEGAQQSGKHNFKELGPVVLHLYWKQFAPALASISELWYPVYNSSRSLCLSRSERGVCTGGSFCCLALAYDCRAHNAVAAPETSSRLLPTGVVNRSPISPQGPRL